jgi:2-polyprenyl-3-methyl-5-hydroxy-6-metoxy-1,4-benzoquinol methylase
LQVTGWVQNRRQFRHNITVLELVDTFVSTNDDKSQWDKRIPCVLHPQTCSEAAIYSAILAPGAQVVLLGYSSGARLWVTGARLMRSSWRPVTIRRVLESTLDSQEVAGALQISETELDRILQAPVVERQWAASELSTRLQNPLSRTAVVTQQQLAVLERYQDLLHNHYPLITTIAGSSTRTTSPERQGSRWERKKLPQLEWMLQQVEAICQSHADYGKRPLQILDVGGGKGLLATHLAGALEEVEIRVLDVDKRAIHNGRMRSERLSLPVRFEAGDASVAQVDGIDVVVALHACGALTDVALGHAVTNQAAFVICPCCFASNPHLRLPNGQAVEEWLGVPAVDFSTVKRLAEIQSDQNLASRAIYTICS